MLRHLVAAAAGACVLAGGAAFAGPADDPANWRKVDPENLLQLTVNKQEILIELRPDVAPVHVEQIRKIARDGNYDRLPFHRVIDDFMAQGGEVYAVYQIYPRYPTLKAEFTWQRDPAKQKVTWIGATPEGDRLGYLDGVLVQGQPDEIAMISAPPVARTWMIHCPGVASMARTSDPDSADTQFFLMRQARVGPSGLDQKYTPWGMALTGLDVIRSIKHGDPEQNGVMGPSVADKLTKAVVVADLPKSRQPSVYVRRTDGPEFAARLPSLTVASPAEACALPPVEVVVERTAP